MKRVLSRPHDDRLNLRPPILALCFFFGLFVGMYVHGLHVVEKPPDVVVPPPRPPAKDGKANGQEAGKGEDASSGEGGLAPVPSSAPEIAVVAPAVEPTPAARALEPEALVIDAMPPEPPVAFAAQVGLTGRTASPPLVASDGPKQAAGDGSTPAPGPRKSPQVDFQQFSPF